MSAGANVENTARDTPQNSLRVSQLMTFRSSDIRISGKNKKESLRGENQGHKHRRHWQRCSWVWGDKSVTWFQAKHMISAVESIRSALPLPAGPPFTWIVLWTGVWREFYTASSMCERKTSEKVWTQFSRAPPQDMCENSSAGRRPAGIQGLESEDVARLLSTVNKTPLCFTA